MSGYVVSQVDSRQMSRIDRHTNGTRCHSQFNANPFQREMKLEDRNYLFRLIGDLIVSNWTFMEEISVVIFASDDDALMNSWFSLWSQQMTYLNNSYRFRQFNFVNVFNWSFRLEIASKKVTQVTSFYLRLLTHIQMK